MTASSTPAAPAIPLTTSLTDPSPPTRTRRSAPAATASRARAVSCPGSSEISASPASPSAAARCATSGQRLPVEPPAEAGLTRKTVRRALMAVLRGRCGLERDAGHAIHRSTELVVGDPHELALDDDVADGKQAPGEDAAQRPDREERRGLHLDRKDP